VREAGIADLPATAQLQVSQAGQRSQVRKAGIADLPATSQVQAREAGQRGEVRKAGGADLRATSQVQVREAGQRREVREAGIAELGTLGQVQVREAGQCGKVSKVDVVDRATPCEIQVCEGRQRADMRDVCVVAATLLRNALAQLVDEHVHKLQAQTGCALNFMVVRQFTKRAILLIHVEQSTSSMSHRGRTRHSQCRSQSTNAQFTWDTCRYSSMRPGSCARAGRNAAHHGFGRLCAGEVEACEAWHGRDGAGEEDRGVSRADYGQRVTRGGSDGTAAHASQAELRRGGSNLADVPGKDGDGAGSRGRHPVSCIAIGQRARWATADMDREESLEVKYGVT
jgi:hypothetical protein